jgi:hypothetical protein
MALFDPTEELEELLSLNNLMLNSAKLVAVSQVDLPATWMMDQFFPPPPDLTNLDAEAKPGILREEESRHKNRRSVRAQRRLSNAGHGQQWWSPTAWIQNWVETSVSIANSAYEMKKNWDELVAAKQAERDRQKLAKLDESDTSTTISGYTTPHLVPNVIVTSSTLVSIDLTTYKINRFSINCKCYTKYFLVLASQHCFEKTIYTESQQIENFSKYFEGPPNL